MGDTLSTGNGEFAAANWMALSTDATAPQSANTGLAGEITLGTMARAQAVFAHTTGASSYTLTRVITSDQEVTPRKLGIFTAAGGGVLVFEALISNPPTLASGDQFAITHSVQL